MADGSFSGWEQVEQNMQSLKNRVGNNARVLMTVAGGRIAHEAKRTAPWTDRTGDARRSIHHEVHEDAGGIVVSVGIGVHYGKYLELSNGGKYRVIDPVVSGFGRQEMQNVLKDLLD